MTASGEKIAVPVEWAWQGKAPEDRGYRLLACSTGDINGKNFEEILDRFSPGTLDKLPQITVSYVPGTDGAGYLSMAFHEEAAWGVDRLGRDVTFTRFFCVPYKQLAAGSVSYLAMCQAFERIRLPEVNGPPFSVELSRPATAIPGDAARALPVAELLLTGNPVCIVDGESTSMMERLTYIDTVMSLLPYGLRAEMAAATWTSSTYRLHKYRLSFSEAPRRVADSGLDDHLVRWRPDQMEIARAPETRVPAGYGDEYRQWLQPLLEGPSITADLAQDTTPRAFKATEIDHMLDVIQARQQKRFSWSRPQKRREIAVKNDEVPVRPVQPPESRHAKPAHQDRIEALIAHIAESLNNPGRDARTVYPYLEELGVELARNAPLSDDSRQRYRVRIANNGLLRDSVQIARGKKTGFYKVLLRTAFGETISYLDYCKIEKMLHDKIPDKPLLHAVDETLGADRQADSRALFIVRYHLNGGKYSKSEFGPVKLLKIAADRDLREDHAKLIWDATTSALRDARLADVERLILPLLRERRFLALELHALAPMDLEFQITALKGLLKAVYRDRVGPNAFPDILAGSRTHYPTLALFLAVNQLTADEDAGAMLAQFIWGLAESRMVPEDARPGLIRLADSLEPDSGPAEAASAPGQVRSTELAIPSSRTVAVNMMNNLQPADPPKERRHRIRRLLNPSGEFSVAEEKARGSDDR